MKELFSKAQRRNFDFHPLQLHTAIFLKTYSNRDTVALSHNQVLHWILTSLNGIQICRIHPERFCECVTLSKDTSWLKKTTTYEYKH